MDEQSYKPHLPQASSGSLTPSRSTAPLPIHGRSGSPVPAPPPPRSPRINSSKPPSPPPPRRSAELRRDRDVKTTAGTGGGATDRAASPFSQLKVADNGRHTPQTNLSTEASPFTSPPSSPVSEDDEEPPELPMRRPPSRSDAAIRYAPENGAFAPPPVHHTVVDKRKDRGGQGDIRPNLPVRSKTQEQIAKRPSIAATYDQPPPQPPRPNGRQPQSQQLPAPSSTTKLAVSSNVPTNSGQQFLPPPTRAHARTRTAESTIEYDSSAAGASDGRHQPLGSAPDLPDITLVNRKPPYIKKGCYEVQTRYDPKRMDVCGDLVCSSGHLTRVWNILDGEQIMSLAHTEGIKATAVAFKPSANPDKEGSRIWVATNVGDIMEVDVVSNRILASRAALHGRYEMAKIYRYYNELWTLDEGGNLSLWGPDTDGMPNLNNGPTHSYKVPRGHTFSMVAGDELWYAAGKALRVFNPSLDGSSTFQTLQYPLTTDGAGDIIAGAVVPSDPERVYFGHNDGKVSVYSLSDYKCEKVVHTSVARIMSMAAVGSKLWISYNTGKISVFETNEPTWKMVKDWQAHETTVYQMKSDAASPYVLDRLQVLSLGNDGKIKIWDGSLRDDTLEQGLRNNEERYCNFSDLNVLVMSWNAGATTPHSLRYSDGDATFFKDLLHSSGSPDILIFGFQELVDLEDKTATAKRFLKSKTRDGSDNERMSHQYRDWRDFLLKTLDDYMPADDLYHLLYNAPLVGLFSCVFVKSSLQGRVRNLNGTEVKRGMGGLHGNKGAVVVRFQVDDSSLCFVNCHLAAGQSHTSSRHTDLASILEANLFPVERDPDARLNNFVGGGDGSMILDHELCILNGDLNYRIDTMSRDTVVKAVKQGNLTKLLERDQLLAARRKNPSFRLRAFEELPIKFDPTYKYDVGTDRYDTSEKKRSPAWCDRMLFRSQGKIKQMDYQRHEVRVSDHRPVSGCFVLRTKRIDSRARATVWMECQQRYDDENQKEVANGRYVKLYSRSGLMKSTNSHYRVNYLENFCGFDEASTKRYIKSKLANQSR